MAFVDYNLACPNCDSSDAFAIDDKGWGKCFSCGSNVPPAATEGSSGRVVAMPSRKPPTEPYNASQAIVVRPLTDRKIQAETCQRYGVGWRGPHLVFPYGEAAKIRINGEKQFKIEGAWQESTELFGQSLFAAGQKYIIVVEGEMDALAAHQMMGYKTPVVSVRNGAQSALKDVKANYEYLDSFDNVIFCFDNDVAGHEAQMAVQSSSATKPNVLCMSQA
jgi:twinkle protein